VVVLWADKEQTVFSDVLDPQSGSHPLDLFPLWLRELPIKQRQLLTNHRWVLTVVVDMMM